MKRKFWPNLYKLVEELIAVAFVGCLLKAVIKSFPLTELLSFMGLLSASILGIKKASDAYQSKHGVAIKDEEALVGK